MEDMGIFGPKLGFYTDPVMTSVWLTNAGKLAASSTHLTV